MESSTLSLTRVVERKSSWVDVLVICQLILVIYLGVKVSHQWNAPLRPKVEIDLSFYALPWYTFLSLCRGLVAFVLSFFFTLIYGYTAAKVRGAEKVMIPVLDILQSIPVLGFMPGVVLFMVGLFPKSNIGLELACVIMIFTAQVWNMTFSFYHSIRAIPSDLLEAAQIYRFGRLRRFLRVEFPYTLVGLVWNGMMSMAGGWFFLTINEAFQLGDKDFRLPGVGAYMSVAIDKGDTGAMVAAIFAMMLMIVILDQCFWRPLVAWSDRFKFEETGSSVAPHSWMLTLIRRSVLLGYLEEFFTQENMERVLPGNLGGRTVEEEAPEGAPKVRFTSKIPWGKFLIWGMFFFLSGCGVYGTFKMAEMLGTVQVSEWKEIIISAAYTFGRTTLAIIIGTLWTVPAGIYIGTHKRASEKLQPLIQMAASFPAPMLFPIVLMILARFDISLGWGAVVLMLLGTHWYILFNVAAGAQAIPEELHEVAALYGYSWKQRWTELLLPGVFPYLVTGWVTAAGGAWNASIVSEYITSAGKVHKATGLGAYISQAAADAKMPELAAAVLVMAFLVVVINRTFWKRLYHLAETRYSLSK